MKRTQLKKEALNQGKLNWHCYGCYSAATATFDISTPQTHNRPVFKMASVKWQE